MITFSEQILIHLLEIRAIDGINLDITQFISAGFNSSKEIEDLNKVSHILASLESSGLIHLDYQPHRIGSSHNGTTYNFTNTRVISGLTTIGREKITDKIRQNNIDDLVEKQTKSSIQTNNSVIATNEISVKNMRLSKWQTLIQFPILIIMCWATIETCKMRKTSQEQTAKASMPLVIFDVESKGFNYTAPYLKNVGYGPALNVNISGIDNRNLRLKFTKVNGIPKDGQVFLEFDISDTTGKNPISFPKYDSLSFNRFLNYRGEHFMGRVSGQSFGEIEISYEDLIGKKFITKQELYFDWLDNRLSSTIKEFPKTD